MAIDPSIPLAVGGGRESGVTGGQDPLDSIHKIGQIRAQANQNALFQSEMGARTALGPIFAKNIDPKTGDWDIAGVQRDLSRDPAAAFKAPEIMAQLAARRQTQLANAKTELEMANTYLGMLDTTFSGLLEKGEHVNRNDVVKQLSQLGTKLRVSGMTHGLADPDHMAQVLMMVPDSSNGIQEMVRQAVIRNMDAKQRVDTIFGQIKEIDQGGNITSVRQSPFTGEVTPLRGFGKGLTPGEAADVVTLQQEGKPPIQVMKGDLVKRGRGEGGGGAASNQPQPEEGGEGGGIPIAQDGDENSGQSPPEGGHFAVGPDGRPLGQSLPLQMDGTDQAELATRPPTWPPLTDAEQNPGPEGGGGSARPPQEGPEGGEGPGRIAGQTLPVGSGVIPVAGNGQTPGIATRPGTVPLAERGVQPLETPRRVLGRGLSLSDQEYLQQAGKNGAEYEKNLNETVSNSQGLLKRLEEQRDLLKDIRAGGGSKLRAKVGELAQTLGLPTKWADELAGGNLGATQEFTKNAVIGAMETLRQTMPAGSRINMLEYSNFDKNNPNIDTDPRAIEKIFNFATRMYKLNKAEQDALVAERKKPGFNVLDWPNKWMNMAEQRGLLKVEEPTGLNRDSKPSIPLGKTNRRTPDEIMQEFR